MPPSPRRPNRHAALIAAVLVALVFTQTLGLIHRVVHANWALSEPAAAWSPPAALASPDYSHGLGALFGSHLGHADCQSFDQLSHGDLLRSVAVLLLPPIVPAHAVLIHRTPHGAARLLGFLARGPPPLS